MDRVGKAVRWLGVAAIPMAISVLLWGMPSPLSPFEVATAPLEPALVAIGRWLGLGLTIWLLASQILYTLAVLTRTDWLVETLRPFTVPLARRVAAGLASVSITMSSTAPQALAQTTPSSAVETEIDRVATGLRQEATPTPILEPIQGCQPTATALPEHEGSYSAPLTWLVRPGDHLWSISGEHLAIVLARAPTVDEHTRYWVRVIESARPLISSGDPDLIYPGEEIPLPPTIDAGIEP